MGAEAKVDARRGCGTDVGRETAPREARAPTDVFAGAHTETIDRATRGGGGGGPDDADDPTTRRRVGDNRDGDCALSFVIRLISARARVR